MTPQVLTKTALNLMQQWNLQSQGWQFRLNTNKRRLGYCSYRKKIISVSKLIAEINPEPITLDTIKHEIAHALVGPGNGHNYIWKQKALIVGCKPKACCTDNNFVSPQGNWIAICSCCNKTYHFYRTPNGAKKYLCSICRTPISFQDINGNPPPIKVKANYIAICPCGKHIKNRKPSGIRICLKCRSLLCFQKKLNVTTGVKQ